MFIESNVDVTETYFIFQKQIKKKCQRHAIPLAHYTCITPTQLQCPLDINRKLREKIELRFFFINSF